jgi:hypothetical protein
MRSTIFWDVIPCSLVEVYRLLRGSRCLHPWGKACLLLLTGRLFRFLFDSEDCGNMFLRNVSKLLPDYTSSHHSIEDSTLDSHRSENRKFNIMNWNLNVSHYSYWKPKFVPMATQNCTKIVLRSWSRGQNQYNQSIMECSGGYVRVRVPCLLPGVITEADRRDSEPEGTSCASMKLFRSQWLVILSQYLSFLHNHDTLWYSHNATTRCGRFL